MLVLTGCYPLFLFPLVVDKIRPKVVFQLQELSSELGTSLGTFSLNQFWSYFRNFGKQIFYFELLPVFWSKV